LSEPSPQPSPFEGERVDTPISREEEIGMEVETPKEEAEILLPTLTQFSPTGREEATEGTSPQVEKVEKKDNKEKKAIVVETKKESTNKDKKKSSNNRKQNNKSNTP
jgi:hypothetical protein